MRPREGAKPIDLAVLRKALEDRRTWCGLARVVKRDGDSSHFEIEKNDSGSPVDVLVEIDLMPEGIPVTARLGCGAGSLGAGGWKIPAPGSEVVWVAPHGDLESDLMIVATLSANSVPGALDGDTFVLVQPKNVIIASQDLGSKVMLGSPDGSDVQPAIRGDDLINRLQNLENAHNNHKHGYSGGTGSSVSGGAVSAVAGTTDGPDVTASGSPDPRSQHVSLK